MKGTLISLCLALLAGCTAQDMADFKAGYERGKAMRDKFLNSLANGVGEYARGYAQGAAQYQATHTPYTVHTGLINTPQGTGLYSIDSNGNGIVNPPIGSGEGPIMIHTDTLGNIWEY